jgi:hypothetical protein
MVVLEPFSEVRRVLWIVLDPSCVDNWRLSGSDKPAIFEAEPLTICRLEAVPEVRNVA